MAFSPYSAIVHRFATGRINVSFAPSRPRCSSVTQTKAVQRQKKNRRIIIVKWKLYSGAFFSAGRKMTILQLLFCAAKSNEIEQMNINHECCLRQSEKKTIYQFMEISAFFPFVLKAKQKGAGERQCICKTTIYRFPLFSAALLCAAHCVHK